MKYNFYHDPVRQAIAEFEEYIGIELDEEDSGLDIQFKSNKYYWKLGLHKDDLGMLTIYCSASFQVIAPKIKEYSLIRINELNKHIPYIGICIRDMNGEECLILYLRIKAKDARPLVIEDKIKLLEKSMYAIVHKLKTQ